MARENKSETRVRVKLLIIRKLVKLGGTSVTCIVYRVRFSQTFLRITSDLTSDLLNVSSGESESVLSDIE